MSRFDTNFFDYFNYVSKLLEARPLLLGGTAGYSGGIGGRPGGFVGQLPQIYVSYDTSELESDYTPTNYSGASLIDNLNHIRFRIAELEDSFSTGLTVQKDNITVLSGVTILDFRGGANVVTGDPGEVIVTIIASGAGGVSDHGLLTGLLDDDHPQYLTSGRGDARYYPQEITDLLLSRKIGADFFQAKGDLITSSGFQTATILPVGEDGQILIADSTVDVGIRWAIPSSGWAVVLSGIVGEGPGIDIVGGGTVGLGGDSILLMKNDGNPIAEYPATTVGFESASTAAVAGNIVQLCAITISGDHTLKAGVEYIGVDTILTGMITAASGAVLRDVFINRSVTSSGNLIGIAGQSTGTFRVIDSKIIVTQSGAGDAYGVYQVNNGIVEVVDCYTRATSVTGSGYGSYCVGGTLVFDGGTRLGSSRSGVTF